MAKTPTAGILPRDQTAWDKSRREYQQSPTDPASVEAGLATTRVSEETDKQSPTDPASVETGLATTRVSDETDKQSPTDPASVEAGLATTRVSEETDKQSPTDPASVETGLATTGTDSQPRPVAKPASTGMEPVGRENYRRATRLVVAKPASTGTGPAGKGKPPAVRSPSFTSFVSGGARGGGAVCPIRRRIQERAVRRRGLRGLPHRAPGAGGRRRGRPAGPCGGP